MNLPVLTLLIVIILFIKGNVVPKTLLVCLNNKGIIFTTVVNNWTFPDSFIPLELIHVKNQIKLKPNDTDKVELVANSGIKKLAAPRIAIAIAPLLTQQAIQ